MDETSIRHLFTTSYILLVRSSCSAPVVLCSIQVRKVICEWLAWILRMSRPGRSLSRRYLQRKARMRELSAKSPPSMSLISNVKDVDNAIPLNTYRYVVAGGGGNSRKGSLFFTPTLIQVLQKLR